MYVQADGKYLKWQPTWQDTGESDPDGGTDYNCLMVNLEVGPDSGKWADGWCTRINNYICEIDLDQAEL